MASLISWTKEMFTSSFHLLGFTEQLMSHFPFTNSLTLSLSTTPLPMEQDIAKEEQSHFCKTSYSQTDLNLKN
jgi:hypothetical protein